MIFGLQPGSEFVGKLLVWPDNSLHTSDDNLSILAKKSENQIRIKLEKVIMVGSEDFTLAGCPIVPRNIATVDAICVAVNYTESPRVTFYNPRAPRRPGTDFIREKKVILRIEKVTVKPNLS